MQYIELSEMTSIFFYLCIVLVTTGFIHRANQLQESKKSHWMLLFAIVVASIPAMMRYGVGKDYIPYYEIGNQIGRMSDVSYAISYKSYIESSFSICAYYIYKLLGDSTYVIGLYALLTQIFMILGAWEFREYVKPEAVIYIYMCSFYWRTYNIFRQALAVAIVFWGIHFLLKKRIVPFVIAVCIATFIHKSAIISLLMVFYFRYTGQKNKTSARTELFLPLVAVLLLDYLYSLVAKIPILSRYVKYYSESVQQSIFTPGTILELMILILYVTYRIRKRESSQYDANVLNVFDKSIVCEIVFYFLMFRIKFAARIGLYFTAPAYCAFAYICGKETICYHRLKFTIYQMSFILISLSFFISAMISNGYGQLPYRFWIPW